MRHYLSSIMPRRRASAASHDRSRCSACRRFPVPGEIVHELDNHRLVCQLCLNRMPEALRSTIGSERILASDRPLAVARRAA